MTLVASATLFVAYAALASAALWLRPPSFAVAPFWLGGGLALGVLLRQPRARWPALGAAVAAACVATNLAFGLPLASTLGFAAVNVGEPLALAWTIRRLLPGRVITLHRLNETLLLMGTAAAGCALAATAGAAVAVGAGGAGYAAAWKTFFAHDLLGILIATPLVLGWWRPDGRALSLPRPGRAAEALACFGGLVAVVGVQASLPARESGVLLGALWAFPFLLWAALRFGVRGTTAAALLLAVPTLTATFVGTGPFAVEGWSPARRALAVELALGLHLLPMLVLASVLAQRRSADESLRASEHRYRRIIETTHVGVWLIDEDVRTSFVNRRMAEMLGASPEELVGRPALDLVDPAWTTEAARAIEHRAPGVPESLDLPFLRHDRTHLWARMTVDPVLDERGGYAGALGMITDLSEVMEAESERRALEDQLRQSQKLEAIGQLAGGVAHDFNNLLTVMIGYSELLRSEVSPGSPAGEMVDDVLAAGERARGLTRQLLAFSRRQELQRQPLDLNALVRESLRMISRLIGEDVRVETDLDPQLPPVLADRSQIEQALMNLAVNARDAMPRGGRLTVGTRREALGIDGAARLEVIDTGVGMDPEIRLRAAEPFFTTKETGRGTGLGLATVHGIASQHGGRLDIESEPGLGTRVAITLPATRADLAAHDQETAPPARGDERVLVVDDDPAVLQLAVTLLESLGYKAVGALGPEEARQTFDKDPSAFDVLLTDVIMPHGTGAELHSRLARQRPGLRALFMTGYPADVLRQRADGAPPARTVEKPFSRSSLARRLREVLDEGRPG